LTPRLPIVACLSLALLLAFALLSGGASAATGATPVASPDCGAVQYGGGGAPQALIVSDLPLRGDSQRRSTQMNDAIRLVLEGAGWRAGGLAVGFQACDDSGPSGLWTKPICEANAQAYAADPSVLGVVGTYNSGCAEIEIPILGSAPEGGVAMVSPGNTSICLTRSAPICGRIGNLYPHGRNYARVVPNDAYQGAGLALFAKRKRLHRVYVLYTGQDKTSFGQATSFRGAAGKLGIRIVGFRSVDPGVSTFGPLMRKVKATSPDGVLLASLVEQSGPALIKAKVAALGPNGGRVKLLAPDGFAQQSTIDLAGPASKGMFVSVPGLVPQRLKGPGKRLVAQLRGEVKGPIELYAPYAGQAASVVLDAIAKGGTRAGTIAAVRATKVSNGIVGSFEILPSGDPSVGPITVSVARKSFAPVSEIEPGLGLVNAARKGRP
jgi:branched-chain amino acid transport system substrate-binding protein